MKALNWLSDTIFEVERVKFQCCINDYTQKTDDERFILLKDRGSLDQYATMLADQRPQNMLEFGIFQGGSPALFALWFDLQRFVGIDICPPVEPFEKFCRTHPIGERIHSYYGVSQTEAGRVKEIVQAEFGETPVDVIVDDASHTYRFTRRTFEIAFPLLRPGGTYVIEDWGWAHWPGDMHTSYKDQTALSMLLMELVMLCASRPDLISEIRVFPAFAFIRKSLIAPALPRLCLESLYQKRGIELVGERDYNLKALAGLFANTLRGSTRRAIDRRKRHARKRSGR
jgi:cephalosporin hydroxylase